MIDQNEKNAMLDYAIMLLDGIGVSINKEEAVKYMKKSADLGNSEAMAIYGNFRFYGIETKVNKDESIQYLKKSVEKENLRGMLELAMILLKSHVVENIKEAVKYLKQIINKGNSIMMNEIEVQFFGMKDRYVYAKAMSIYGEMLYYGIGVQVDKNESIKLLKKSFELNDPKGKLIYAKILLKDDDVKSKIEASNYFKELISNGDAEAMYEYGMMLMEGNGIPMNKKEAIKYIIKASELNCSEAIIQYGLMLIDGKEFPENTEKVIKCFKKAADLGNIYGMLSYGIIILKSKDIKSYKKAAELFKKCIDIISGNYFIKTEEHIIISSVAMLCYGNMLLKGLGIPKNIKKAVNYLKQSAD